MADRLLGVVLRPSTDRAARVQTRRSLIGQKQSYEPRPWERSFAAIRVEAELENTAGYWITSSARSRSDCGTVRPRAAAVLRLTTSSNLVGRSIGRSPGFSPFKIRST